LVYIPEVWLTAIESSTSLDHTMQTSQATPYIFAALMVILCANSGVTQWLGAHPFWSVKVAWYGTPLGLILAFLAKRAGLAWLTRTAIFLFCLALAYAIASSGKERFAASFAEDAIAGRMWFFGWVATAGFAAASIAAIFNPTRNRQPQEIETRQK
jgi:hypothetical protein